MYTILHGGLVHDVVDLNKAKRAGRTTCWLYLDFKPSELNAGPITCLTCLGDSLCTCEHRPSPGTDDYVSDHAEDCDVRCGVEWIDERYADWIRPCKERGEHLVEVDDDGFCQACGYQES